MDIGDDTDERRANAISLLDADFHGLLQVKEVSELIQARLSVQRVRSISRWSTIADDRAGLRQFCTATLRLRQDQDVVEIAALVDSWEAGRTRMEVRRKAEAEASLSQVPRAVNKVEVQDLAARFERLFGYALEDRTMPSSATLEHELVAIHLQGGCRGRGAGSND